MGGELGVSELSSNEDVVADNGGGAIVRHHKLHTEVFEEYFPYYLSLGMTPEQYWQGENSLPKAYRKAEELRKERRNADSYILASYFYEALCDVSPILHAFAKKGTKPIEWRSEPYALTKEAQQMVEEKHEKAIAEKGKAKFRAMINRQNTEGKEET